MKHAWHILIVGWGSTVAGLHLRDILTASPNPGFQVNCQQLDSPCSTYGLDTIVAKASGFAPSIILVLLPHATQTPDARRALDSLKEKGHLTYSVLLSCAESEPGSIRVLGANDVHLLTLRPDEVPGWLAWLLTEDVVEGVEAARRIRESPGLADIIGASPVLVAQLEKIAAVAGHDVDVLIRGETGTGKELFAHAIHYQSKRREGPWVPLNCGAVPSELFENELFGHASGAYTGANGESRGLVDQARGGTLFLDEVDALPLAAQVKLLRFVQNREYRPLGAQRSRLADVRLIAACNADLAQAVLARRFRADLYYRLSVFEFDLPPLRERRDDIEMLAQHFLGELARRFGKEPCRLTECARQRLLSHHWPGNIRELQNALARAFLTTTSTVISAEDLQIKPCPGSEPEAGFECSWSKAQEKFEDSYLRGLMRQWNGNTPQAARAAGLHLRTLQRLLRKHRLQP